MRSDLDDAAVGVNFDPATTVPDPLNAQRLVVGFHTGTDPRTWTSPEFVASTAAFNRRSATDTLSFTVQAPEGKYISKITYRQTGTSSISRTASTAGMTHWVVDGEATGIGSGATATGTVDLTGQNKTSVPVSITTGLFVFTSGVGSASLRITSAEVLVEVLPV